MIITNPIPANQVVDVDIDLKCLDEGGGNNCGNTLKYVLQKIVDKIGDNLCGLEDLDFKCLTESDNLPDILQSIINKLDCSNTSGGSGVGTGTGTTTVNGSSVVLTGLTNCTTDNFSCSSATGCLTITDPCNHTSVTLQFVIQTLINRIVAQSNIIKTLCERMTGLQLQIDTINLRIDALRNCCD